MLIGFGLVATNQFSGAFSIFNYSITILEQSEGFSLDTGISTILLGFLQILGTCSATLTVDRFGRKVVLLISASCTALGLLTAGTFDYLSYEFDALKSHSWILVLALASVIYFANMGVCTVCYVVLVEVLPFKVSFLVFKISITNVPPLKIRAVGTSICLILSSSLSFTTLKLFPVLMEAIGFHGLMWTFGILMALGFLFIATFVPETKGKSFVE